MYTYDYDLTYIPSMPVVEVEVSLVGQLEHPTRLAAMLDTGSDGSMMPLTVLKQMNARRVDQVAMRSITGARSIVDIYQISFRLGPYSFPKVRVAADRYNPIMILGRDVLNHMIIVLNGFAGTTEIHD